MSNINQLIDFLDDGKGSSKLAFEIEEYLQMDQGHTQESTREFIREAICEGHYPIGSGSSGFFLIDSEEELLEVVQNLQNRIDGMQRRIEGLIGGWNKRKESRAVGKNWPKC